MIGPAVVSGAAVGPAEPLGLAPGRAAASSRGGAGRFLFGELGGLRLLPPVVEVVPVGVVGVVAPVLVGLLVGVVGAGLVGVVGGGCCCCWVFGGYCWATRRK